MGKERRVLAGAEFAPEGWLVLAHTTVKRLARKDRRR